MDSAILNQLIRDTFLLSEGTAFEDQHGPNEIAGWDSLGHVNLISALETKFQIAIPMDEMIGIASIGDIKKMLQAKGIQNF